MTAAQNKNFQDMSTMRYVTTVPSFVLFFANDSFETSTSLYTQFYESYAWGRG